MRLVDDRRTNDADGKTWNVDESTRSVEWRERNGVLGKMQSVYRRW